jgi:site-specific DNA-methyltransferase (adenine-specific)
LARHELVDKLMRAEVIHGEALTEMRRLIERGITFDACLTDPPYGTTACAWDSVIPFEPMWANLKRLVKKNGAIALFGSQPFTSALVMSNPVMFRYEWAWVKSIYGDVFNAKNKPMKKHENVLVFSRGTTANCSKVKMIYNPQGLTPINKTVRNVETVRAFFAPRPSHQETYVQENTSYPHSILDYDNETGFHPTQKPVELMRYLVRTYSNEGDTILDFTCGSGSTGVACVIEKRNFIGIEQDEHYVEIARARIKRAQGQWAEIPKRKVDDKVYPLFESNAQETSVISS